MTNNEYIPVFQSKTLGRFFGKLDKTVLNLEEENEVLRFEKKELEDAFWKQKHAELKRTEKEMFGVLGLMLGGGDKDTSVQVATVLARVRDMQTIEEVHEYCHSVLGSIKESMGV